MPFHLIPHKSGVHRAACFALFRALLSRVRDLPLPEPLRNSASEQVKTVIRRNLELQGREISTALSLGYETLEVLQSDTGWQTLSSSILKIGGQRSAKQNILTKHGRVNAVRVSHQSTKPRVAPYPGASKVLDRPFQNLSGRRHVPVLVNANRVPILRLKKPQSPFLSRVIRDQVNTREARILLGNKLAGEIPIARGEDTWDHIVARTFGLDKDTGEEPWTQAIECALHELHEKQDAAIRKRKATAERMHQIVEQEKALAEKEKLAIRDKKHEAKKVRRLARKADDSPAERAPTAIEDNSGPEKTIYPPAQDLTSSSKRAAVEKTRPIEMKERYIRSRDSTVAWTDHELVEIKAARTKRKELKALAKVAKVKKKEENVKYWAEKLKGKTDRVTVEFPNTEGDAISAIFRGKTISQLRQKGGV
ncbi:hypothetical protein P7C71_g2350, partial [Lecanoromycetidae sp. Uapishka_2]